MPLDLVVKKASSSPVRISQVEMPEVPAGRHSYFHAFTGKIAIGGERFREGETGPIT